MNPIRGDGGGARRFHRKSVPLLTEINVTPFVDVMLVLLIIFMVTAPLMKSGANVDLPKESMGALDIREENVIEVRADEAIFYNGDRVSEAELESRMKNLAATSPTAEVFLKADQSLTYAAVMAIMGIVKNAGVERLGMVTEMPTGNKKKRR